MAINFAHLKELMETGVCLWYAPERLLCIDKALLVQLTEADYNAMVDWHVETLGEYYDAVQALSRIWHRKRRKALQAENVNRVHKQCLRLSAPGVVAYVAQMYARAFEGFDGLPLWITGEREPVQIRDEADNLVGLLMVCDPRAIERLA